MEVIKLSIRVRTEIGFFFRRTKDQTKSFTSPTTSFAVPMKLRYITVSSRRSCEKYNSIAQYSIRTTSTGACIQMQLQAPCHPFLTKHSVCNP